MVNIIINIINIIITNNIIINSNITTLITWGLALLVRLIMLFIDDD